MEFDALFLSRVQFGVTTAFHIIFPTMTIGTALFLAFLEGAWLRTGNPVYQRLYRFWIKLFALAFGIDYSQPDLYLIPGQQSALSDSFFDIVLQDLGQIAEGITGVKQICSWINTNFEVSPAGGALIGRFDVNELFDKRLIFGCHSNALVQIGILRKAGYPSVMVETASVSWIEAYNKNQDKYVCFHMHKATINVSIVNGKGG